MNPTITPNKRLIRVLTETSCEQITSRLFLALPFFLALAMDQISHRDNCRASRAFFPIELVETILDELVERTSNGSLSQDSEKHLKQCTLVNRTFRSRSQWRLFHHLDLSNEQRFLSISHILQNSPHITSMVQSLRLCGNDDLTFEGLILLSSIIHASDVRFRGEAL